MTANIIYRHPYSLCDCHCHSFRRIYLFVVLCTYRIIATIENQPLFYIYEWTDAKFNVTTESAYASPEAKYLRVPGHGFEIDVSRGFYDTWQFSLYKTIESRAVADGARRTMNPDLASTFIIPYDIGMDAMVARDSEKLRRTNCPLSGTISQKLLSSPYFQRSRGHNHLVVLSIGQTMDYFLDAKNCKKFFSLCFNCTKLAVDDYSFTNNFPRRHFLASRGNYWHAVPYPANVHYNSRIQKLYPWEKKLSRSNVVAVIGSYKTSHNMASNRILMSLIDSCDRSEKVVHQTASPSTTTGCEWISPSTQSHQLSHRAALKQLASKSVFCVIVPDDVPTRQAVFDSILQGCIPVFLDQLSAPLMYEWHWGYERWQAASVCFDIYKEVLVYNSSSVNIVAMLLDMYKSNRASVEAKQDIISKYAYQLQYSVPVVGTAEAPSSASVAAAPAVGSERNTKSYGGDDAISSSGGDAYDIAISATLAIHTGKRTHKRVTPYVVCERMKKFRHGEICRSTNSTIDYRVE